MITIGGVGSYLAVLTLNVEPVPGEGLQALAWLVTAVMGLAGLVVTVVKSSDGNEFFLRVFAVKKICRRKQNDPQGASPRAVGSLLGLA